MFMASLAGLIALPLMLLSVLLPVALVAALQVWLCKRRSRWLGLILPGLTLLGQPADPAVYGRLYPGGSVGSGL